MSPLLFLVHRIPYPPNKGDKIRSFHLLKALVSRYRVYLGAFIDTPEDRHHLRALREMCADICVPELAPGRRKMFSVRGLMNGKSLTETYYWHRELASWVESTVAAQGIERAVVFSSSMGQFVRPPLASRLRGVIDLCDLDSEKWREYSSRKSWPLSALYAREARRLEEVEGALARRFAATLFVSDQEAGSFRSRAPDLADRVQVVRNGVDASYFDPANFPQRKWSDPVRQIPEGRRWVVFTGAMDYWANVEAVCWFADDVWPRIIEKFADAQFVIVGARPSRAVRRLASRPGVYVTGAVEDVRPYLSVARVAVAPLRIARGVQNKVLEAMAMARRVVAAPAALRGIAAPLPEDIRVAGTAPEFVAAVCEALSEESEFSAKNREYVLRHYDWTDSLTQFLDIVGEDVGVPRGVAAA